MLKKLLFVLLFGLAGIAFYYFFSPSGGNIKQEVEYFTIADTSEISKIIISDKDKTLSLQRKKNNWKINGKFTARREAVFYALKIIKQLQLNAPVPNSDTDSILQNINSDGLNVEIYTSAKAKEFKISKLKNPSGSYFYDENIEKPLVLYVPGMNKNISAYFSTNPIFWRDKTILNYQPTEIQSIELSYSGAPEKSFKLEYNEIFNLFDSENNKIEKFDVEEVKNYFSLFTTIEYKKLITENEALFDSITSKTPDIIISVINSDKEKNTLKLYKKYDKNGKPDLNLLYGLQGEDTFFWVTYYSLDLVLKEKQDFIRQ